MSGDALRTRLAALDQSIRDATALDRRHPSDQRMADGLADLSGILSDLIDMLYPPAPPAPPPRVEPEEVSTFDGEPVGEFDCTSSLMMAGRGRLYCGFYPFDDPVCVGKLIRISGEVVRVRGIERFALLRPVQKGDAIAFLVSKP